MKELPAAALLAACLLAAAVPRAAGAAAVPGAEAREFDQTLGKLQAVPGDRELFLYAVEMLPGNSRVRARRLAAVSADRLAKSGEDYAWRLGACAALRALGDVPEALANCRKALELDPTVYPVYRELGLTYAAAGNHRKAAETLAQGVEISSASRQAYYRLGRELERRGEHAGAAASYKRGLALPGAPAGLDASYYVPLLKSGVKRAEALKARRSAPAAGPDRKRRAADCLKEFRDAVLKDAPAAALERGEACLKLSPSDPALAAERAPLLVRLGRYEDGVKEYERAAGLRPKGGREAARLRVKAAETWQKLGEPQKALAQYRLAVQAAPDDAAALTGLAAALEARSDFGGAVKIYDRILQLEPANAEARTRREELRTSTLSSAQLLEELKLRKAVDQALTDLQPEDLKLFKSLKAAELAGGVDYLKEKAPSAAGLTVRHESSGTARILMTGHGYKVYNFHATRDAVKFFEREGVGMREIFTLRNGSGEPVFDKAGKLTPEGEEFWRGLTPGKKTWLLTYEPVPESPKAVQAGKDISAAEKEGYREISEPEYLWLLRATDCPEDVLAKPPVSLRVINDGARVRYLLCYAANSYCMNVVNEKLPSYIEAYRSGNDEIGGEVHSGFFGAKAVKKHRFCEDGKILGVDLDQPLPPAVPG